MKHSFLIPAVATVIAFVAVIIAIAVKIVLTCNDFSYLPSFLLSIPAMLAYWAGPWITIFLAFLTFAIMLVALSRVISTKNSH